MLVLYMHLNMMNEIQNSI